MLIAFLIREMVEYNLLVEVDYFSSLSRMDSRKKADILAHPLPRLLQYCKVRSHFRRADMTGTDRSWYIQYRKHIAEDRPC